MKIRGQIRLQRHRGRWLGIVDDDRVRDARGTSLLQLRDFDDDVPAEIVAEEMRRRHRRARVTVDAY